MAQATWEKPAVAQPALRRKGGERIKFLVGGVLILAAVVLLVANGMASGTRFFMTVESLLNDPAYLGQSVRVSGAVLGDTIRYDAENLIIEFTVVHVPDQVGDEGAALHAAVNDPNATPLRVRVEGQVRPDLLQHEARALMTGTLDENGVFHATELNLQCPSRFTEGGPQNAAMSEPGV